MSVSENINYMGATSQLSGTNESAIYTVDTTDFSTTVAVTSITATAYDVSTTPGTPADVTSTVIPSGSPSAVAGTITLPAITALSIGTTYEIWVKFTFGSGNYTRYFEIVCSK